MRPRRKWGGRPERRWVAAVLAKYGTECWLQFPDVCTGRATTGDHIIPRSVRPDLEFVIENGRPACFPCNRKRSCNPVRRPAPVDARGFFESAASDRPDLPPFSPPSVQKLRERGRP